MKLYRYLCTISNYYYGFNADKSPVVIISTQVTDYKVHFIVLTAK